MIKKNIIKVKLTDGRTIKLDLDRINFPYLEINPRKPYSGIYCCLCLVNYKFYLGSSSDCRGRKWGHLSDLRQGIHYNPYFQNAFTKYGECNFLWFCIEKDIVEKDLKRLEQFYLDAFKAYDPEIGYNISKFADRSSGGDTSCEYKFISFSGKIYEGKNLLKFSRENNYTICHLAALKNGKRKYYKDLIRFEDIDKIDTIFKEVTDKRTKREFYKLISPTGEIHEGYDRSIFCKKMGLKLKDIGSLCRKETVKHKGWRIFDPIIHPNRTLTREELASLDKKDFNKRNVKEYEFYHYGEKIQISNLVKFCEVNSLDSQTMFYIYHGRRHKSYNGYTSGIEEIRNQQFEEKYHLVIDLIGEIKKFSNITSFCFNKNIDLSLISFHNKKNRFYKGYYIIRNAHKLSPAALALLIKEKKKLLFPNGLPKTPPETAAKEEIPTVINIKDQELIQTAIAA